IVAVAIAIAIAVAFWMTGIVTIFTGQVEQLQIVSASPSGSAGSYEIKVIVKNAGTTSVTVDGVFITPSDLVVSGTTTLSCSAGSISSTDGLNGIDTNSACTIDPGESATITISNLDGSPGQSVEVKLHTAAGKEYPKLLVLP
ncbi:MAG: DUF4352 domain-containing protein, partial [Thermoprotei archaeon]